MRRETDQRQTAWRPAWLAIGLTWLVTAVLVVWGAVELRGQIRQQITERDGVLLQAMARVVRAAAAEDDMALPDDPLLVLLRMDRLEGVLAARLYDGEGDFVASLPASVREGGVSEADWEALRRLDPVSRFHSGFLLADILWVTNTVEWLARSEPIPAMEVWVPLQRREDNGFDAAAWFLLDGRGVAREFALLDRRLARQAGWIVAGAWAVTGGALGWAFRRLARANALLARRTEDLQQANLELSQSARVSALGAVAAHLMHGLKSPVSGLQTFVAAQAQAQSGVAGDEAWMDALAATRRMQSLIRQVVRVLADHQLGLAYEVSLGEVAEEVVRRSRPMADARGVRLVREGDPPGGLDNRTAGLLILLLSNLVENAVEATPSGREVRIRLGGDGGWSCEVMDEGGGLAAEARQRLFQPQSSRKEGGSGVGLAITRQLALALGGTVRLVSTGPGGTVFRVEIPAARSEASVAKDTSHPVRHHGIT
ncbi:MAG: HAMP domain-containing histidine kinase [Verrucomicrobiae bacterium]|nr:HAMP domain-containing histidine kinase [Verrucomicrobiae bacterium]